jgi:23S rRNA (adenine2030-N6)-methyltransferase
MNYRHAFHAGNFADVHKHVVLLALLAHLHRKPKAIVYLDTHAGRGHYDLRSVESTRADEWRGGIGRLTDARPRSPYLQRYLQAVRGFAHSPTDVSTYPGSPLLALATLREQDRAVFVERQVTEARLLEHAVGGRRRVSVSCDDGYAALKAYLPPPENRGFVLMDPPYEAPDEFSLAGQALKTGLSRWPNGIFALWYPIKAGPDAGRLHGMLAQSGLRKLLMLEMSVRPHDSPLALNGSGIIVANPPWQFDTEMREATHELHTLLSSDGAGRSRVEWLVAE